MTRLIALTTALVFCVTPAFAQKKKVKANTNASQEYKNVYHSPSADSTPQVFRSVLQMEVIAKRGSAEAEIVYANGVVVSNDGLIVAVVDAPGAKEELEVDSGAVLMLDGTSKAAKLLSYSAEYGTAVFRADSEGLRPLSISKSPLVAKRRLSWHTIYRDGRKTWLYTRPLRVHKSAKEVATTKDLCEVIDLGTSALSPERSGSALLAHDGSLVGVMGRLKHWNVTPKNVTPRTKTAWAVPASVILKLVDQATAE